MPGAYSWIWDTTNGKWVKQAGTPAGAMSIHAIVEALVDVIDVVVTALADNDILYWDAGTSQWQNIAHLGVADAHHAKYTDANAVTAMGAKADANPLHHDRTVKYTNGEAVLAVEAAGLALASGKNIKVISALTADHTWSGLSAVMTAGAALTRGQAVYVGGDSKMELADADAAASMPIIALVTPANLAENAAGEFLMQGFFRDDTWAWTSGGILYASVTPGGLSQAAPVGAGDQVQVVGIAITADIIYFNPSFELVEVS